MRILVASGEWFPDRKSGFARVVTETATHLAERGHEVTVLAPSQLHRPVEATQGSLTVERRIRRGALPLTFTDIVQTRKHARTHKRSGFDVLLAHGSLTALGLGSAALDVPIVLTFHASLPREVLFARSRLPFGTARIGGYALAPALTRLERAAVRHADRILVLSEFSRSLLVADHPSAAAKARRVAGGVDTRFFTPADGVTAARERLGVREDMTLLLAARRLEPRMGLEQLLAATKDLLRTHTLTLAIVGQGSLGQRLDQLRGELGLESNVRLIGQVADDQLRDWYRAADLVVLPTVAYEGFGMATVEALASGTPVVGTPVGATPELLRPLDARLIADDSGPKALTAAIARSLDLADSELRERCREYACSNFAWDKVIVPWERELYSVAKSA
jgi:glycosyltransferase involved in cell wall biosynthesis